ncbi:MAG: hypothetical protein CM1200mP20_16530 [Pseudomonadota bacterium]|nr:MAG: hypothetical protein CM1200mP20_16530 [Pseudomonadota bacterium]
MGAFLVEHTGRVDTLGFLPDLGQYGIDRFPRCDGETDPPVTDWSRSGQDQITHARQSHECLSLTPSDWPRRLIPARPG